MYLVYLEQQAPNDYSQKTISIRGVKQLPREVKIGNATARMLGDVKYEVETIYGNRFTVNSREVVEIGHE